MEKRHIGAYGILRKKNQILLVLKTRGPYVGKFDLPGGSLQHGEGIKEALQRELVEEVGCKVLLEQFQLFDVISTVTKYKENESLISFYHIGIIFQVNFFKEEEISFCINDQDVNGAFWIDFSFDEKLLSPLALDVIKRLNNLKSE